MDRTQHSITIHRELLGLAKTAQENDIKRAYRQYALKHHPDKVGEANRQKATAAFQKVQAAYEICMEWFERNETLEDDMDLDMDMDSDSDVDVDVDSDSDSDLDMDSEYDSEDEDEDEDDEDPEERCQFLALYRAKRIRTWARKYELVTPMLNLGPRKAADWGYLPMVMGREKHHAKSWKHVLKRHEAFHDWSGKLCNTIENQKRRISAKKRLELFERQVRALVKRNTENPPHDPESALLKTIERERTRMLLLRDVAEEEQGQLIRQENKKKRKMKAKRTRHMLWMEKLELAVRQRIKRLEFYESLPLSPSPPPPPSPPALPPSPPPSPPPAVASTDEFPPLSSIRPLVVSWPPSGVWCRVATTLHGGATTMGGGRKGLGSSYPLPHKHSSI